MKILLFTYFVVLLFTQVHSQTFFDLRKQYPTTTNDTYNSSLEHLKKYSEIEVKAAFDLINSSEIEFNYTQGGCQNRAHIMSLMLKKKLQLSHAKIWIFSPGNITSNIKGGLEISDKNRLAPNDKIVWNYHVAPCLLMIRGGKIDTMIIDPSINNQGPIKIREWFAAMNYSSLGKYTFLNPEWYFFYLNNANVLTGAFYQYRAESGFCPDNYRSLTLEKSLAINDMAIYILNKRLNSLRNSTQESENSKFNSLRLVFGNVDVLTSFFCKLSNYCGFTPDYNLSLRQYYYDHPDIMSEAMSYYIDRLNFWTVEFKTLE